MELKDRIKPIGGLNKDDNPTVMPQGDYPGALNVRVISSDEQHGAGIIETMQGEIEMLIRAAVEVVYYGGAIGAEFLYDGFEEVQIGDQVWMKHNWDDNYPGSKVYNNDESNRAIYGGLYTWYQTREEDFLPAGWRLPTEADIDELLTYLGGELIAGGKMKEFGTERWLEPNTGGNDESGFSGRPGGKYEEAFSLLGEAGLFWLEDEHDISLRFTTNKTGIFSMTLLGITGEPYIILWGDGSHEKGTFTGSNQIFSHTYTSSPHEIAIIQGYDNIIDLIVPNQDLTDIVFPENMTELLFIHLDYNSLTYVSLPKGALYLNQVYIRYNTLTSFDCPSELENIYLIDLTGNQLTSFEGKATWVNLTYLILGFNHISSLTTCAEWTALYVLDLRNNNLTSFTSRPEWVNLEALILEFNSLTTFTAPAEWVNIEAITIDNNQLTSLTLPVEWTKLRIVFANDNYLTSITARAEFVDLEVFDAGNNNLSSFTVYDTWSNITRFVLRYNSLTESEVNSILINLDTAGISDATIDLFGGTNAAPTGEGIIAMNNLISRGCTVLVNE